MLIILKALLVVGVVPFILAVYLGTAEKLKNEKWYRRWILNWSFLILVLALAAVSALEVLSYERSAPSNEAGKPLHFMPLEAYEKELDAVSPKPSDWIQRKQELVRKFQFAQYAYDQRDYSKSIDALTELEKGQDPLGPLFHAVSYVVANDIGCAYFKKQRNRGFLASRYLLLAQSRVPPDSVEAHQLDENVSLLDELVNRLD